MTKRDPRPTALFSFCIGLLAVVASACSSNDTEYEASLEWKRELFQRMQINLSQPVAERVQKMPADLLKAIQAFERSIDIKNSHRYITRTATEDELALIKSYIELLPPAHRTVFSKKLLAVYLVEGFSGAGLTDWVVDRQGRTYYYLVLNSDLFKVSLDDWLTYKENSLFDQSATLPTMRVRTQTKFKALMYGLLHEGTHIVDYEFGVTPYVDSQHRRLSSRTREVSEFTGAVWIQQTQPKAQYDFKHRGNLNIYGIFSKKRFIPRSELSETFLQLTKTPFISFYSGWSWNEDLADYVTYYHIEKKLGGTVTVELIHEGNVIDRYIPVKTSQAQQREKAIRVFYD